MSLFPRRQGSTRLLVEAAARALSEGKVVNFVTAHREQDQNIRDSIRKELTGLIPSEETEKTLKRLFFTHMDGSDAFMGGREGPTLIDVYAFEKAYTEKVDAKQALMTIKKALEAVLERLR